MIYQFSHEMKYKQYNIKLKGALINEINKEVHQMHYVQNNPLNLFDISFRGC